MLLGCIADDFTGATDLANNLVRAGMRCVLTNGVPLTAPEASADAVVVALKSRTIAPELAVEQSLAAQRWLTDHGARQIYFKVCSTFDSTDQGNIGPVTEALMQSLGSEFAIACPAFPENKRTIFKGYLFAGEVLLNEGGMQNHPLTPMTDPNLVRVLQRQCRSKVGLIDYATVAQGALAIRERIAGLRGEGFRMAIVDATSNDDLMSIGAAVHDLAVITAGSGVAIGLPQNFGISPSPGASELPATAGRSAVISGSCSLATQGQVGAYVAAAQPAYLIDVHAVAAGRQQVAAALAWFATLPADAVPLLYSTADSNVVRGLQQQFGVERSGKLIEDTLAAIAVGLVKQGVRNLVVAGGETSGAVVQALAIEQLRIGPQIDPGVPWCATTSSVVPGQPLRLALKSGNFGAPDFFLKAWDVL
jgi:3-dehydrotetronate 4-kinase